MSRESLVTLAVQQLGVKEDPAGSNKQMYGAWYGRDGVPWCAEFVSWVYAMSGNALPHIDTDKGYHYVPSAYNWFVANKKLTPAPQPGDIIIYDWEQGKVGETAQEKLADHTGIFEKWLDQKAGTFYAIEGNTSAGNNSNGGQVQRRQRSTSKVKAFVNILTQI